MCGVCVASSAKAFREDPEQAGVVGGAMLEHRGVWFQEDVNGGDLGLRGREDLFPIVLHADHGPAVFLRIVVKRLREAPSLTSGNPRAGP